ncbi:MAG: tetratricopeptide repeat protein, partial [Gemmatimonadetes bacterium]|nr:tetratricopeptide repeat protein [Gemmatimonadota bacterium]
MGPDSPASDEIRRFEEQYRRQPESLVFARLADAYRKAGQPKRALAVLEEGLIRHPDYPSGHIVRARALRDMGRVDETLESFRRVLELDAANLVAIRELAGLADERGDVDEARHWYERLGQIDPTNLEVSQRLRELETASVEPVPAEPVENEPVE